jgi:diaminopimelate decarboxylase
MSNVRSAVTDELDFYGLSTPMELVETYGSPLYVYNENVLRRRCRELKGLSSHPGFRVNYSAKANANLSLLRIIRSEGLVVDAMSPGEIAMHLAAGFTPDEITYVCNNVSAEELRNAVDHGLLVSVDSLSQLDLLGQVNPGGKVMIRINPGIGAGHHKKVVTGGKETKFGIGPDDGDAVRRILKRHNLTLAGLNQHIGSLFMEPDSYLEAVEFLLREAEQWDSLEVIDFGGGFGIPYRKYEKQPRLDMEATGRMLDDCIGRWADRTGYNGRFMIEPGRYVTAECGVVLGTVHAVKNNGERRFAGTDLGFNVLQRPVMYDAFHDVEIYREDGVPQQETMQQTIVGNICESGDIMAAARDLPEIQEGDIIAMLDAGAYGFAMSSSYNQRLRPAEVLVDKDGRDRLIRRRETLDDLLACFPEYAEKTGGSVRVAGGRG